MARTKRRSKVKSQKRTLNIFKNLYLTYKSKSFSYVNIKDDERFFTDNQKTPNWKFEYKKSNRRFRYTGKKVLRDYEFYKEDFYNKSLKRKSLVKEIYDYY